MNKYPSLLPVATLVALLFLPSTVSGQRHRGPNPIDRLDARLDLTDDQKTELEAAVADVDGPASWHLAAALQKTLTDEQKEKLLAPLDMRNQRPGTRRTESRSARHAQMMEQMKSERNEALGLTDAQAQAFDELVEKKRSERLQPQMPEEMGELLTPAQLEIVQIHHALMTSRRPGMKGRSGRGMRR